MKTFTQTHILPDIHGNFGQYGGRFVPPQLEPILQEIATTYDRVKNDPEFIQELTYLHKHFTGRPSPIYHLKNLSAQLGGAQIYLKREDLNHTGAHKINHCLGEALLAKKMGKKKLIAETGAGQHGVALATAAALVGLECDIYMGEADMEKEYPNVVRIKILGAQIIPVKSGFRSLKEAVDEAFMAYISDPVTQFYAIGSVVGPHPFPAMVRDFQSIVGQEAREQILEQTNKLPDYLVACIGGGSNAIGLFSAFLDDEGVKMIGVEPAGSGPQIGQHAATLTYGKPGIIHGFKCYVLSDGEGNPAPVHTIASGLDYPGVGPEHSYLKDIGRVQYTTIDDNEAIEAFKTLSRTEEIIPALESAHAVAHAIKMAPDLPNNQIIVVNLSGRGDKDIDFIMQKYGDRF
ncbi:MAG: tryptophan synthase subunit beta [Candidatus Gracilibacteria bacterium]